MNRPDPAAKLQGAVSLLGLLLVACNGLVLSPRLGIGDTAFTVGGTLSGLAAGTGVVLQINAGDNLTVGQDGAFTFVTPLPAGTAYTVTVFAQPAGQACNVTGGGSGTIAGAAVTNVTVECGPVGPPPPGTHSVGGTVSGLGNGKSVVLQNNGTNNTVVNTNGSFTFSTPVSEGQNYAVTVATQPSGQSCSVSNGTGVMGTANVTNVTVTCTTLSYTVGGSVTGLNGGTQVVLRLNGGNNTTVSSNTTFTFPTSLADGTAYTVSVFTQPAGQTCSVTNGSGTIAGANVTNVAVSCTTIGYTVGGSVTGLNGGAQVVLRLNGGNNTTVSSNTTFTFSSTLANGASYAVTVFTQPAGQTCSVTNGGGTIAGANVTNVSVTCTTTAVTYSVGGSVSGMTGGTQVVLRLNGGNNTTVSSNTTFTFSTQLANAASYAVTVFTQPVGQTCSVTNGSGTIAGANVTNVSVTCTANPTYSVGGSVSGLNGGTQVVLRLNGGNNTTVSSNTTFTFSNQLASGASYAVTVFTQPAGQTCSVTNGSGTIASANVTNVSVSCVDNSTSGALDPAYGGGDGFTVHGNAAGGGGNDLATAMTRDGSGRVLATGYSVNSSGSLTMTLWRYTAAGVLDTTFNGTGFVTHDGLGVSANSENVGGGVMVDGSGRIVVTGWSIAPDGATWGVAVWRFLANGTPDSALGGSGFVRVATAFQEGVGGAIDGSGRILVAGFVFNGTDWDIGVWRFLDDGNLDTAFNGSGVFTHSSAAGGNEEDIAVSLALDSSGRILVTGYSTGLGGAGGTGQDMALWRLNANGTLDTAFNGTGFLIHNSGGGLASDSGRAIAFDSSGRIVVTGWSGTNGDDLAIWRVTTAGALDTTFNGTGFVTHNSAAGGNARDEGRGLVIDGSGRIVVVGSSANPGSPTDPGDVLDIALWRYNANGTLDTTFGGTGFVTFGGLAGGIDQGDQGRDIRLDGNGNYLVTGLSTNAADNFDTVTLRVLP